LTRAPLLPSERARLDGAVEKVVSAVADMRRASRRQIAGRHGATLEHADSSDRVGLAWDELRLVVKAVAIAALQREDRA
jgi:hypothetical protein